MNFTETPLAGAYLIDLQKHVDERGYFARAWCRREFEAHGLNPNVEQVNVGYSRRAGTLRGLHFQQQPHAEVKVVRCLRGAIYDVIVDLRPQSPTRFGWFGVELRGENGRMLYVPEGFAHGYQTLSDDVEMMYQTSQAFEPRSACGVRFDDPAFGIRWPREVTCVSDADRSWPFVGQASGVPNRSDRLEACTI
jgi:dTDP-4-dehydrorhamnose 3,5-epimerase